MAILRPNRYFTRISAIDPVTDLRSIGVRAVLLDMDNTLLTRDTHEVPQDVRQWLERAKQAGITPCILTNNCHKSAHDCARQIGLPIVARALKPLPFSYFAACKKLGVKRSETACIGDQLMTDIWGGRLFGMHAIMVKPLVEADLKHTLFLRKIEKRILRDMPTER